MMKSLMICFLDVFLIRYSSEVERIESDVHFDQCFLEKEFDVTKEDLEF